MKVLTLNLHSYQEDKQMEKFNEIAKKLVDLKIDVASFCEASQPLTQMTDKKITEGNALQIICDKMNSISDDHYEVRWEFAHYGFAVYEEGLGVITKLPVVSMESRFISKSTSPFDYRSRKILKVKVIEPETNEKTSIYVIHTNMDNDPYDNFAKQFVHLQNWIDESKEENEHILLAGDFGIEPNSLSYNRLIDSDYVDYYSECNPEGLFDYTFLNPIGLEYTHLKKVRVDYILGDDNYTCIDASYYFLEKDRVSDHVAVYCELSKA